MNQVLEIHIDELVLHGFSPHDRHRIGDAVRQALYNRLTENGLHGVLNQGGYTPFLDAGFFNMHSSQKPETIGGNIAENIYQGFANESGL